MPLANECCIECRAQVKIEPADATFFRETACWRYPSPYDFYDGDQEPVKNPERFLPSGTLAHSSAATGSKTALCRAGVSSRAFSGSRTYICGLVSRRPNRWTIPAPLPTSLRRFRSDYRSSRDLILAPPCPR
jgi:hypothetical protein